MRIENDMHVSASMEEAWALLTDIPAIAPCLPGAKLIDQDGDTYEGTMKVKVGPIVAEYSGTATVVEMNETDRTVKLTASGPQQRAPRSRGAHQQQRALTSILRDGNASPVSDIFASMVEARRRHDGETSNREPSIATDLKVAGKVAGVHGMPRTPVRLLHTRHRHIAGRRWPTSPSQTARAVRRVDDIEAKLQQADVVYEAETEPETVEAPNDEADRDISSRITEIVAIHR